MGINTPVQLIAPVTGAVTTKAPYKVTQDRLPVTILADGLAGAEEVDLYWSIDGGTTWVLLQQSGSPVALTATNNAVKIDTPMMLGVVKDATVGACGVYAATANKA